MDTKALGEFYKDKLLNEVEPFWFPRSLDTVNGGLYHCYAADGTLVDTDKNVWAQGRMAWMLLTCYNSIEKRPEWMQYAESALKFLEEKCVDPTDGRMYFHMTADGTPIRKRRYACYVDVVHNRQPTTFLGCFVHNSAQKIACVKSERIFPCVVFHLSVKSVCDFAYGHFLLSI